MTVDGPPEPAWNSVVIMRIRKRFDVVKTMRSTHDDDRRASVSGLVQLSMHLG